MFFWSFWRTNIKDFALKMFIVADNFFIKIF